jgi:hypothetical protein
VEHLRRISILSTVVTLARVTNRCGCISASRSGTRRRRQDCASQAMAMGVGIDAAGLRLLPSRPSRERHKPGALPPRAATGCMLAPTYVDSLTRAKQRRQSSCALLPASERALHAPACKVLHHRGVIWEVLFATWVRLARVATRQRIPSGQESPAGRCLHYDGHL